eukprot:PhM_4_TR13196/c0_g1_i1/m.24840
MLSHVSQLRHRNHILHLRQQKVRKQCHQTGQKEEENEGPLLLFYSTYSNKKCFIPSQPPPHVVARAAAYEKYCSTGHGLWVLFEALVIILVLIVSLSVLLMTTIREQRVSANELKLATFEALTTPQQQKQQFTFAEHFITVICPNYLIGMFPLNPNPTLEKVPERWLRENVVISPLTVTTKMKSTTIDGNTARQRMIMFSTESVCREYALLFNSADNNNNNNYYYCVSLVVANLNDDTKIVLGHVNMCFSSLGNSVNVDTTSSSFAFVALPLVWSSRLEVFIVIWCLIWLPVTTVVRGAVFYYYYYHYRHASSSSATEENNNIINKEIEIQQCICCGAMWKNNKNKSCFVCHYQSPFYSFFSLFHNPCVPWETVFFATCAILFLTSCYLRYYDAQKKVTSLLSSASSIEEIYKSSPSIVKSVTNVVDNADVLMSCSFLFAFASLSSFFLRHFNTNISQKLYRLVVATILFFTSPVLLFCVSCTLVGFGFLFYYDDGDGDAEVSMSVIKRAVFFFFFDGDEDKQTTSSGSLLFLLSASSVLCVVHGIVFIDVSWRARLFVLVPQPPSHGYVSMRMLIQTIEQLLSSKKQKLLLLLSATSIAETDIQRRHEEYVKAYPFLSVE